jgi:uncharacterized protein
MHLSDADLEQAQRDLANLARHVAALGSVVVCFSGGVDSSVVLAVSARQLGADAVALTAVSPALPRAERESAARLAEHLGVRHEWVDSQELQRPGYVANGPDRCFYCKSELYEIAESRRVQWGLLRIANGTNLDDLDDHRPGLMAAEQSHVASPLAELGLGKRRVRAVARVLGLPIWSKPASACLASRIPYGTSVTRERLAQIEELESRLRALGLRQVRVRWHDTIARIEVDLVELDALLAAREAVLEAGKASGFTYVTLDLGGYRQGSHNEVVGRRALPLLDS